MKTRNQNQQHDSSALRQGDVIAPATKAKVLRDALAEALKLLDDEDFLSDDEDLF